MRYSYSYEYWKTYDSTRRGGTTMWSERTVMKFLPFRISRRTHGYLSRYFDNIDMEVAEDVLCDFEEVHKDLRLGLVI